MDSAGLIGARPPVVALGGASLGGVWLGCMPSASLSGVSMGGDSVKVISGMSAATDFEVDGGVFSDVIDSNGDCDEWGKAADFPERC